MDAPLPQDFLAQAEELIESLLADIQELRRDDAPTGRARRALVDRIFRHAHTLKGAASSVPGLRAAARLAHELENLLHAVRAGRTVADDAALDACEDATEHLSRHIVCAARGTRPESADAMIDQLRRLAARREDSPARAATSTDARAYAATETHEAIPNDQRAASPDATISTTSNATPDAGSNAPHHATSNATRDADADAALASLPDDIAALLNAQERARLAAALAEDGARCVVVSVAFDIADLDEQFRRLTDALETSCEIVSTLPGDGGNNDAPAERIGFRLLCVATEPPGELSRLLAPFNARLTDEDEPPRFDASGARDFDEAAPRIEARRQTEIDSRTEAAPRIEIEPQNISDAGTPEPLDESGSQNDDERELRQLDEGAAQSFAANAAQQLSSDEDAPPQPEVAPPHEETLMRESPTQTQNTAREFATTAQESESPADDEASATSAPSPSFVRITLAELDDLAFAANELFDDTMRVLEAAHAPTFDARASDESASRLRANFLALVERVMALRMQTLARPLERAARAARVAARRAGKRIEIEIEGGGARVDRAVAERLAEPLAHLVRNAIAHGIESPAERRKAGKPERGRLRLVAATEGSRVRISVTDDGRGIDSESIERAARAQGLIRDDARFTEEQALRLIFRPGFSTAANVSMNAGRGVGLDAVEQEIEQAGGDVRVRTRRGQGTTFELRLPLALALVPALLVRAGANSYALDAGCVVETFAPETSEFAAGDDNDARLRWRDSQLSLVDLRALVGQTAQATRDDATRVVIIRADDARGAHDDGASNGDAREKREPRLCAVRVDGLLGRRDALVRSLGRHATRWRGVSGAIDLRDGTTALMLDLPRLLES
jgi:chemotaxis protein histidine kinase CheA